MCISSWIFPRKINIAVKPRPTESQDSRKAGTKEDGNKLVDIAFSTKDPHLALNDLSNQNEINQQKGFVEMLKGVVYFYRNVNAHSAKIQTNYSETGSLEALMIISFLRKRLDECKLTKSKQIYEKNT